MKSPKLALASGIPVYCSFTKIVSAQSLKRHPKNPKNHPPKQLDRYQLVVAGNGKKAGNGWRRAPVVSARSGFVTKGNGAVEMAARRGWDVPIEIQRYNSAAEEIRDILADNRLAELATTDDTKLRELLAELDATELQFTAFDDADLQKLLKETKPETLSIGASFEIIIECANEAEQKKHFERFAKEGLKCRVLTL